MAAEDERSVNGRPVSRGLALAALLLVAAARPASALSLWTVTGAPATMTAGTATDIRLTVTNLGGLPLLTIGCVTIFVPTPSSVTSLQVSSVSGSWSTSSAAVTGGRLITYHATSSGDRLTVLESGDFRSRVTATGSGVQTWQVVAYDAMTCDSGAFPAKTFNVVVNGTGPTPTPAPTAPPTAAPTPTPAPTPAPTPGPTATPTPTPSPVPTTPPWPTLGPTAGPGSTPTPDPTAGPGSTPTPDPTARPDQTPAASATAPPPGTPTATFDTGPTASDPTGAAAPTIDPVVSIGPGAGGSPDPGTPAPGETDAAGGIVVGSGGGSGQGLGTDWLVVPEEAGTAVAFDLGSVNLAGMGVFLWAVPGAVLVIPGFLVIVVVLLQTVGGLVWLPLVRRRIGGFGRARR
jgi:hypothetical protein